MLYAAINRELDGGQILLDRKPRFAQIRQTILVHPALHAGNALIVGIDQTDNMRSVGATWIKPPFLGPKTDARQAKCHNLALLARGQLTFQPDKTKPAFELAIGFFLIEIGQHRGQKFQCLVRIDDPLRLGKERGGFDVRRERLAIAIDQIRSRCGLRNRMRLRKAFVLNPEIDKPRTYNSVNCRKTQHCDNHTIARASAFEFSRALQGIVRLA